MPLRDPPHRSQSHDRADRSPKQSDQAPAGCARPLRPARGPRNPKPIDAHYQTIQGAMRGIFHELGLAARPSTIFLQGFALKRLTFQPFLYARTRTAMSGPPSDVEARSRRRAKPVAD